MSFEQPVYRYGAIVVSLDSSTILTLGSIHSFYSGGEPPTPTKTPTSPNFFLNSFQTPKQDSRSHGPFSPWTPTFPLATSPDFKTPTRLSFAIPTKSPTRSSRPPTGQDLETEIASHVHLLSSNPGLPLPPVEPRRQLSSSPNLSDTTKRKRPRLEPTSFSAVSHNNDSNQDASTSMNSAGSMQTPPPTSTSASRRKAQQAQVARLVKESAEKGGLRMPFPALAAKPTDMELSTSRVEESPQQFTQLHFSPEGFGFPMSTGSTTAPVYPQHKLFWDPEQSGDATIDMNFPMDDTFTAFGIGIQKHLDPFVSSHDQTTRIQFPTSPAFDLIGTRRDNLTAFQSSSVEESLSRTATSANMARKPSRHVVNPSLLFSSPSQAAAEASSMHPASQTIQDDNLRPYAHQLREAKVEMEMEMQNARKPKRKRGLENGDSPAVKVAVQTLREDRTDTSGNTRDVLDLAEAANGRSKSRNSNGSSKGKGAPGQIPLRRQASNVQIHRPASVPQSHKRTSVTLTIDASGRAKTETKVLGNNDGLFSQMDVDNDQESESSSSSSSAGMIMSQPSSFAFPPPKQKLPPIGHFANGPKSHSQKSSYASTLGSGGSIHTQVEASNRRGSSNLYMQSNAYPSQASFDGGAGEESEAETIIDSDDDRGDAQSELKKVLRSRSQKNAPKRALWPQPNKVLPDQRRTYPSRGTTRGPYYTTENLTPTHLGYNDPFSNISPTTITDPDLATPSTGHSDISSDSIRCLCHTTNDDGQLMIQW